MSKIKNLFQKRAAPEQEPPAPEQEASPPPAPVESSGKGAKDKKAQSPLAELQSSPKIRYKGEGSDAAKHRNPEYINLGGVYIKRTLHRALKGYCIQKETQMSDVVGELIQKFLASKGVPMD